MKELHRNLSINTFLFKKTDNKKFEIECILVLCSSNLHNIHKIHKNNLKIRNDNHIFIFYQIFFKALFYYKIEKISI